MREQNNPECAKHKGTKLLCPRCIASRGGRQTAKRHRSKLAVWAKRGGWKNRKKAA
jgi:hypothetical protein